MPVIFAPDESLAIAENSPATTITPVITVDGTPVTPDSLTMVTQPEHGTASVSGTSLLYTPIAGYSGPDSFTYQASVVGLLTNVATVSVIVMPLPVKRLQFEVDMEQDEEATGPLPETCVGVLATPAYVSGAFSPDFYSDDGLHSAILSESATGALIQASLKASLTIIVYASGQTPPVLDQITVAYVGPLVLADGTPVDLVGFVQESQAGYRIGGMTARLDAGALVLGVTAIAGPTSIARAKITGEVCFRGTYNGS